MKENELRIGNLVLTDRGTVKITRFAYNEVRVLINPYKTGNRVFGFMIKELRPVKLTEEWLIKSEFVKNGILYEKGKFAIKAWKVGSDIEWIIFWGDKIILYKGKYHVHQLQNLYFALIGKELSFK